LEDVVPVKVRSRLNVWYYCAALHSKQPRLLYHIGQIFQETYRHRR
jgi:hypothetical protein